MLHSVWLLKMLEKSGHSPRERVLALFDILQDWSTFALHEGERAEHLLSGAQSPLIRYLASQLTDMYLAEPEIVATQIYYIALGLLQTAGAPGTGRPFLQARQAVAILLDASRRKRRHASVALLLT